MNFSNIPPVTLRLIILNALVFVFTGFVSPELGNTFALHYIGSEAFAPYQLVTHMFTHANLSHLFFNMFGVFMFGSMLEKVWGPQRYLIFYFVSGIGALVLHQLVDYWQIQSMMAEMSPEAIAQVKNEGLAIIQSGKNYTDPQAGALNAAINGGMVGASGALFGLLAGFAMLFPNTELMMIFLPVPIKAKYFVLMYAAFELFSGLGNITGHLSGNIAHFAHLGGALFGFILLKIWGNDRDKFY